MLGYTFYQGEKCAEVTKSGPYGGANGVAFNDLSSSNNGPITSILLRHGGVIDAIQLTYGNKLGGHHGGKGGSLKKFNLATGENIIKVQISYDKGNNKYVRRLYFETNKGRKFGPHGNKGSETRTVTAPRDGCSLSYISGKAGRYVNSLSFIWCCPGES